MLEEHGSWRSIACRFNWWGKAGVWQSVLEALRGDGDTEWFLMPDRLTNAGTEPWPSES